ncbi:MAG: hypothetical protein ACE5LH_05220 [Fidelibacterota bacterium]
MPFRSCRYLAPVLLGFHLGLFPVTGLAQGSYTALEIPYHVRTLSMSGGGVADARGADLSMMNPALLMGASFLDGGGRTLLFSVIRYPVDIQSEMAEWRMPWGNRTVAVTLRHLGYGEFDRRDEQNVKTGEFSAGDTWLSVSASRRVWRRVDVGVTGGIFHSRIESVTASLALVTAGASLSIPEVDLVVGVSVRNLGTTLKRYTGYEEVIPTSLSAGLTKGLAHLPLEISVDALWWEKEKRSWWRIGGEFSLPRSLFLRWGLSSYRFDQRTGHVWRDIVTGSALGVAYRTGPLTLDMGFQYAGVGGITVGVGLSAELGGK